MNKSHTYFEQILEIQQQRRGFQDGLELLLDLHARGKVSKKDLDKSIALWHTVESTLKEEVTALYDKAYAEGCFN